MGAKIKQFDNVSWKDCRITGGFWKEKQNRNEESTIPSLYDFFKRTGRMDCMKGLYKPSPDFDDAILDRANGKEEGRLLPDGSLVSLSLSELMGEKVAEDPNRIPRPHQYWDADVAKWIESASYSLRNKPDASKERIIDEIVDAYEKIQFDDGYVNTYFTLVEPGNRFHDIWKKHELYCAGHMIESAIAYYEATGKKKFLEIVMRYIDLIDSLFGPEPGKMQAYPGHQEIELALIKLYRLTRNEKYLSLAKYFIDTRGRQPLYYDYECQRDGRNPNKPVAKGFDVRDGYSDGPYCLSQSHLPVREQGKAVGHAVRDMYMCCGMTDVGIESNDPSLIDAVNTIWDDVVNKKMSVTGGVGAESHGERFSFAYHLPNESAYNETCAAIGHAMWASRMLQITPDTRYSDVLERLAYNGTISGVSLDGESYFYANHLSCEPEIYYDLVERQTRMFPVRQKDFPVSCCPCNITRFIESISGYAFTKSSDAVYVHLYMNTETKLHFAGGDVTLAEETQYPNDGTIRFRIRENGTHPFTLGLRIPGWCSCWTVEINGVLLSNFDVENGYIKIQRNWTQDDELTLRLCMTPVLLEANPQVRSDYDMVAIQCGPFVYCLEETDNDGELFAATLTKDSKLELHYDPELLGGTTYIIATAVRKKREGWDGTLYRKVQEEFEPCVLKAIPYYLWSNRTLGKMTVWIHYR